MQAEGQVVTGVLENISIEGGLLTHATGNLDVGARGRARLMNLSATLRTPSQDVIEIEAEVVRRTLGGFALRFLGGTEVLRGLLERAMGRGTVLPEKRKDR
jgi:hypothetical protein